MVITWHAILLATFSKHVKLKDNEYRCMFYKIG